MGRKQPRCGKHLCFHLTDGVKTVILILIASCMSLLWVDMSVGKTTTGWQLIAQCIGSGEARISAEESLQCMAGLKGQWPAGSPEAQALLLLEPLLETNVKLELELSEKKEIIRILIEQIERIKMIDMEMEERRKGNQQ